MAENKNLMDIAERPLNTESGRSDVASKITGAAFWRSARIAHVVDSLVMRFLV